MNDRLFLVQHDIIKQLAEKPCIIIGRCGDYVLRNRPDCVKLFIYADLDKRTEYAINVHYVPRDRAKAVVVKTDKTRANYYNYYASERWGDPEIYDLCINSGSLGIDGSVELIEFYLKQRGMI